MRGWALRMSGQLTASEDSLRAAIALPNHSGYAHTELSLTLSAQRRYRDAEQALIDCLLDERALPRVPTRPVLELLAEVWETERNLAAVRMALTRLRRDLARDPELWAFDARVRARLGERAEGLQSLRRAIAHGLPPARQQEVLRDFGLTAAEWALVAGA